MKTLKPHGNEDTVHTCMHTDMCDGYSRMPVSAKQGVITSHTIWYRSNHPGLCLCFQLGELDGVEKPQPHWFHTLQVRRLRVQRGRSNSDPMGGKSFQQEFQWVRKRFKHKYTEINNAQSWGKLLLTLTIYNTWLFINCQFITLFF